VLIDCQYREQCDNRRPTRSAAAWIGPKTASVPGCSLSRARTDNSQPLYLINWPLTLVLGFRPECASSSRQVCRSLPRSVGRHADPSGAIPIPPGAVPPADHKRRLLSSQLPLAPRQAATVALSRGNQIQLFAIITSRSGSQSVLESTTAELQTRL